MEIRDENNNIIGVKGSITVDMCDKVSDMYNSMLTDVRNRVENNELKYISELFKYIDNSDIEEFKERIMYAYVMNIKYDHSYSDNEKIKSILSCASAGWVIFESFNKANNEVEALREKYMNEDLDSEI